MGLKVIGAGMGRTGTHSLKLALEYLGLGPCHHMFEVRDVPSQIAHWQAAARGERVAWDEVFNAYTSQVDWPGARYWRELAEHFPDSKVILTIRPPEEWYASFSQTIVRANLIGRTQDPNPHTRAMADMIHESVFNQIFDGRVTERDHVIKTYMQHIADVQASIPESRLLIYQLGDGWEPLCKFLSLPVPEAAFPKTNSKEEFLRRKAFLLDMENMKP